MYEDSVNYGQNRMVLFYRKKPLYAESLPLVGVQHDIFDPNFSWDDLVDSDFLADSIKGKSIISLVHSPAGKD
jgi:hypothetical protein